MPNVTAMSLILSCIVAFLSIIVVLMYTRLLRYMKHQRQLSADIRSGRVTIVARTAEVTTPPSKMSAQAPAFVPRRISTDTWRSYWKKSMDLEKIHFTLIGYSRAGLNTSLYIPELRIRLDAGTPCHFDSDYVFISHGHPDHMGCLDTYMNGHQKTIVYCGAQARPNLLKWVKAMNDLQCGGRSPRKPGQKMIACDHRKTYNVRFTGTPYIVETYACKHSIQVMGYGFSACRTRLKDKFRCLIDTPLLGQVKTLTVAYLDDESDEFSDIKTNLTENGVDVVADDFSADGAIEITTTVIVPQFCYLTDTTTEVFDRHPELQKYSVIITECTYFDLDDLRNAKKKKHTHWNMLKPIIASWRDSDFVLIHTSQKHSNQFLTQFEETEHDAGLTNFKIFTDV